MGKLMDAVKKKDVNTVKQLVADGQDPNKSLKLYGEKTNPYKYAVMCSVWGGVVSNELLEIVEFLTPHMTGYYFENIEGYEFNGHIFYDSYFGEVMILAKSIGASDVVIEAMMKGGYPFNKDPNLGRHIGKVSFSLAKKIFEKFGTDDGSAVCSAVEFGNFELVEYLLDKGVSPNQPIYSSNGAQTIALVSAVMNGNIDIVKRLISAGADPEVQDTGYNKNALEMAKEINNQEIIDFLKSIK